MIRKQITLTTESPSLAEIGHLLKQARIATSLTQEQVADLAGISRPRYRDIETGAAAARATTLINITRALGLEIMLIPHAMVPAVKSLLRPDSDDDLPAFVSQGDENDRGPDAKAPKAISSLDVLLNDLKVGTIVRTPGDFNAFNFEEAYRATGGFPVLSLSSFRAAAGGLRKDPKPLAGALPAFFANLLPEDKLREAMEKHHSGNVRAGNDFDLLAALGADLPGAVRVLPSDGTAAISHLRACR